MTAPCTNPYFNSVAQVVEIVHSAYEGLRLFDELIAEGVAEEPLVQPARFGSGASAVEVPRGILFHEYAYDEEGLCTDANCIIPTGQNHANIQADFDALLPELMAADKTEDEMRLAFEMLVRAYDPCISCSTHYLDVEFVR
jgi:coenzyme F420-reducing hydrogenase alpha subunit